SRELKWLYYEPDLDEQKVRAHFPDENLSEDDIAYLVRCNRLRSLERDSGRGDLVRDRARPYWVPSLDVIASGEIESRWYNRGRRGPFADIDKLWPFLCPTCGRYVPLRNETLERLVRPLAAAGYA